MKIERYRDNQKNRLDDYFWLAGKVFWGVFLGITYQLDKGEQTAQTQYIVIFYRQILYIVFI